MSNGLEKRKIPVVNAFDDTHPPPLIYSNKRIPTEGVNINTEPEFLCGCDCTDNCFDKSKCQCFQMTIAGAKYKNIMPQDPNEISYVYKRLYDEVQTGIYECNSQCKCNEKCLNRVVQHPIQEKLQLFRTKDKGWGIQTLNFIPKGAFICNYVGYLYPEEKANEMCFLPGVQHGDEYYAELDFLEMTQVFKENYENDVVFPENEIMSKEKSRRPSILSSSSSTVSINSGKVEKSNEIFIEISDDEQSEGEAARKLVPTVPVAYKSPSSSKALDLRTLYGSKEKSFIMDAKTTGNLGRYFNHSCNPNMFVQNCFVDTHDLRFPWIAFFARRSILPGEELTWDYNYEVGSVPGKVLYCQCGSKSCKIRIL